MAIKHKSNGGNYSDVAEIVGCHMTMIGKWVDAYRLGKLEDKPPTEKPITTKLKALKEIDIRPELKRIAVILEKTIEGSNKAIEDLTKGLEKVCLRLDSIYQKNIEDHETFDSLLAKGFKKAGNGDKS